MLEVYKEIWKQHSIKVPGDCLATICTILHGKLLTSFETSIVDNLDGDTEEDEVIFVTQYHRYSSSESGLAPSLACLRCFSSLQIHDNMQEVTY